MSTTIVPALGEHGVLAGRTGSGKSTTAYALLCAVLRRHSVLIIDTKGEELFDSWPSTSSPTTALQPARVMVYRPERELNTGPMLDLFLDAIFESRRSLYVYLDEVSQIAESTKPAPGLSNLLRRGRKRTVGGRGVRVSVLCGTQRPAWVPRSVFTESRHFYVHDLNRDDLKSMAGYIGEDLIVDRPPEGHQFWYYRVGMTAPKLLTVQME